MFQQYTLERKVMIIFKSRGQRSFKDHIQQGKHWLKLKDGRRVLRPFPIPSAVSASFWVSLVCLVLFSETVVCSVTVVCSDFCSLVCSVCSPVCSTCSPVSPACSGDLGFVSPSASASCPPSRMAVGFDLYKLLLHEFENSVGVLADFSSATLKTNFVFLNYFLNPR